MTPRKFAICIDDGPMLGTGAPSGLKKYQIYETSEYGSVYSFRDERFIFVDTSEIPECYLALQMGD